MKKLCSIALALALTVGMCGQAGAALIAGWDFQTTATGGTAVAASPSTPKVYSANVGSGTIYLDGTNGSSDWFVPATGSVNTELNGFGGTSVNAGSELSTVTTSPSALAFLGGIATPGPGFAANGKSAVIRLSLTGYQNLSITFAAQRTGTGFTTQLWEWSTDGTSYSTIGTKTAGSSAGDLTSSFATSDVLSFNGISGLDDAADAYVRITFTGASSASGNNRMDNIRFEAQPVPEPSALSLVSGILMGFTFWRRNARVDTVFILNLSAVN